MSSLDFQKAFAKVPHERITIKVRGGGITDIHKNTWKKWSGQ